MPQGRVRPAAVAKQADLDELGAAVSTVADEINNRLTVIEGALAAALDGLAEVQEVLGMLDEELEGDEDAQDDSSPYEGEGPIDRDPAEVEDGEPEDPQLAADLAAERERREAAAPQAQGATTSAAIRRAERAAYGTDEEGPRAKIMTGEMEDLVLGDFNAGEGRQLKAPEGPQGEEGWSGSSPA